MKKELIIFFLILFRFILFSQTTNSSNGYIVVKINAGFFLDSDGKRFERGNPAFDQQGLRCRTGNVIELKQDWSKNLIFPGAEITYYLARNKFFGFNIGLGYSFSKSYFTYASFDRQYVSSNKFIDIKGVGNGSLQNHMFKFTFGFNFNSKGGFNFYIQPLNMEIRSIMNGRSNINFTTSEGLYSKLPNPGHCSPLDSTSIVINTEVKKFEYKNYKTISNSSIAFPTLIGMEQKFTIKKINCVAGISGSFSILEWYSIYRIHLGICFGNFIETKQPGY